MQQEQKQGIVTLGDGFNIFYCFLSWLSLLALLPVRHSFGPEALGKRGVGAFVILLLFAGAHPGDQAIITFIWSWVGVLILQRCITTFRTRRGWIAHSRYDGYPWLAMWTPFVNERSAKVFEWAYCMMLGSCAAEFSEPLAELLVISAFAAFILLFLDREIERKRLVTLRDAELEQRWIMDSYRRGGF